MAAAAGFRIRPERGEDEAERAAIATMLEATFGGDTIQRRLVAAMRGTPEYLPQASLVAETEGAIVGYTMVSRAWLDGPDGRRGIVSLAPLGVAAGYRGQGIGGALLEAVSAAVDDGVVPVLVLEGPPAFYTRHGFEAGPPLGIRSGLTDRAPYDAPLVRRLGAYSEAVRGRVVYPEVFRTVLVDEL